MWLWMMFGEYMFGCLMVVGNGLNVGGVVVVDYFVCYGLIDLVVFDKLCNCCSYYLDFVLVVLLCYWCLCEGDVVMIGVWIWCVVIGFGYLFEYCVFYSEVDGVLIFGDMVLLCILMNVLVFDFELEVNLFVLYFELFGCYEMMVFDMFVLLLYGKLFCGVCMCIV